MRNKNILLFGSVGLIVLAIGLVSILDRATSSTISTGDVRARAAVTKTLEVNATVTSVNQMKGTMVVSNLYFADNSRSSDAKNLGTWTVTAPASVNLASFGPGINVVIGIDPATFLASSHTLTAITIVQTK